MTALDVSSFTNENDDSPELVAFKRRVLAVAKAHSRRSHCGSLNSELDELGIKEERKVTVRVTTTHPFNLTVQVYPSELAGKDEDEQKVVIANSIGDLSLTGVGGMFVITVPPSSIAEMELDPVSVDPDDGFVWMRASQDGRVLHRFSTQRIEEARNLNDRIYSACDQATYPNWLHAGRPNSNRCQSCLNHIDNGRVSAQSLPR